MTRNPSILYAILCYNVENVVGAWSKEEDDAVMARLRKVEDKLEAAGKLGPVARLQPTTTAATLRKGRDAPSIVDGPFAETKEQLAGIIIIDVPDRERALEWARRFPRQPGRKIELRANLVPPSE